MATSRVLFVRQTLSRNGQWSINFNQNVTQFPDTLSDAPWSCAGVFSNLYIFAHTALLSGRSQAYTMLKAGSAQTLTVTITEPAVFAQDITHSVTVAAGDMVNWRPNATGATSGDNDCSVGVLFTATNSKEMGYSGGGNSSANASSTRYAALFAPIGTTGWGTVAPLGDVIAAAGALTRYDIKLGAAPVGAGTYTFTVFKNGVAQDGTGGTTNTVTAITGAATTGSWTGSLTLAKGDRTYMRCVPSSTPAAAAIALGTRILHDSAAAINVFGTTYNAVDNTAARYQGGMTFFNWLASESATKVYNGITPFSVKGLQVYGVNAPTSGRSVAYTIRKNEAASTVTCTVADAAVSAEDTNHTATFNAADYFDLQALPSGTPTIGNVNFSFTQAIPPEVAGGGGGNPHGGPPKGGGKRVFGVTGLVIWDAVNGFGQ